MILLLELSLSNQFLFPGVFQRPGYEPMLRLDRMVLTCCSLDFVDCPFSPLLPESVQFGALLLHPFGGSERQLQSSWLQRGEDLLADEGIEARACQVLALRFAVVSPALHTFIRVKPGTSIIVMDGEPTATTGTDHQTC